MATIYEPNTHARPLIARARGPAAPLPVLAMVFLGYLMLAPPQFNPMIGGSSLPPYRIFLLGSSLFVLASVFGGRVRLAWPDILMALALAWISFAMSMTSTAEEAFTASVAHFADIGFAYFFARAAIRNLRDFRIFLLLMAPGLLILAAFLVIESVTQQHIIQPFFSKITGIGWSYRSDPRLGLMRAQGPFPHPILAGVFLASFICLYWMSGLHRLPRLVGVIAALCSFFTVSAATLIAIVLSVSLLVYSWLTERITNVSWRLFFAIAGIFVFAAETGTNSGTFRLIIRYASFSQDSGGNRVNIWKYGSESVANHPWFGIGYGDWVRAPWMGDSVDNFWLLMAMRFGLPAAFLIFMAMIIAILGLMRRSMQSNLVDSRAERGVAMALSVFAMTLVSVALWLSAQSWFYMLLGIAVSLANAPRPILRPARPVALPVLDLATREHPLGSVPRPPS